MIANFPLWVLILTRYFQRRRENRGLLGYAQQREQIETMMRGMAVPRGKIETWLMAQLVGWLNAERRALETLVALNIRTLILEAESHADFIAQNAEEK